jgi:hypothetical protein
MCTGLRVFLSQAKSLSAEKFLDDMDKISVLERAEELLPILGSVVTSLHALSSQSCG